MIEFKNFLARFPKSWKKSFITGVVTRAKMSFCNECTDKATCNRCKSQAIENEELEANIN